VLAVQRAESQFLIATRIPASVLEQLTSAKLGSGSW
jgi:hypothetical protein